MRGTPYEGCPDHQWVRSARRDWLRSGAPSHHLVDSCRRQGRSGRITSGSTAYLAAKAQGDKSMPSKRGRRKTCTAPPRETRTTWRKLDRLNPSPQRRSAAPRHHVGCEVPGIRGLAERPRNLPPGGAATNEVAEGDERGASLVLGRRPGREDGIASRARAPWRQSPRSSPGPGEPATWRRGAGGAGGTGRGPRDAEMPTPRPRAAGEPDAWKLARPVRRAGCGDGSWLGS